MTMSTHLGWHFPYLRKLVSSCSGSGKVLLTLLLSLASTSIFAQGGAPNAANVEQGANGSLDAPHAVTFQNGNLHGGNSHFLEGHSIPYRLVMSNLTIGNVYVITVAMDALEGGWVAIDYVTGYNNLTPHNFIPHNTPEFINPLVGTTFTDATFGNVISQVPLPTPSYSAPATSGSWTTLAAAKKLITLYGGTVSNPAVNVWYPANTFNPANIGTNTTTPVKLSIRFTASATTALLAWGGHIATQDDYGENKTAATQIQGAPYHMRRGGFTNTDGSVIYDNEGTDRSVSIDAILVCEVTPGVIAGTQSICQGQTPAAFTVPTPATGSGALTYRWESAATCDGPWTPIGGATGATYTPPATLGTIAYHRVAISEGACEAASNCVTVTVNQTPSVVAGNGGPICAGSTLNLTATTVAGGTYAWTGPNGFVSALEDPSIANATTAASGVYSVTVTVNGCTSPASTTTALVNNCGDIYGSYTQGYYGGKGKSCNNDAQVMSPIDLINALIPDAGITVGRPGRSVFIPDGSGSILNMIMPGGKKANWLTNASDLTISTSGTFASSYLTGGKINNILLAQTIALSLNVNLNSSNPDVVDLSDFPIEYTAGADSWFQTFKTSGCDEYNVLETCTDAKYYIPLSVTNYLTKAGTVDATVDNLLDLANDLLGGVLIPGTTVGGYVVPSYADVNSAVDAINRGFDEYTQYVGSYNTNLACPDLLDAGLTTARLSTGSVDQTAALVKLNAFPNPFNDRVSFNIQSNVSGKASLVVYNMVGQKVGDVFQGYVFAGRGQVVEYKVPLSARANLIYIFTINGKQRVGKLINQRF
jgi:hypothetical protein